MLHCPLILYVYSNLFLQFWFLKFMMNNFTVSHQFFYQIFLMLPVNQIQIDSIRLSIDSIRLSIDSIRWFSYFLFLLQVQYYIFLYYWMNERQLNSLFLLSFQCIWFLCSVLTRFSQILQNMDFVYRTHLVLMGCNLSRVLGVQKSNLRDSMIGLLLYIDN